MLVNDNYKLFAGGKTVTDKQREIIRAAMDIVSREGYSKCTIRNVAARVGVTEPAVYRHFRSKIELLTVMLEELQAAILPSLTLQAGGDETLEECLQAFAGRIFTALTERPEFGIFLFFEEAFHQEGDLKPTILGMMERAQKQLSGSLAELQARKICRTDLPPESLALLLMGTLRLMVSKIHLGHPGSREELRDRYVELFIRVLAP
jgi:AcrR family transcriptional regulator